MSAPIHVYEVFVGAPVERVWRAITNPDDTTNYFFGTAVESAFAEGAPFRYTFPDGSGAVEGTVETVEAPHRLVLRWRVLYDPALTEEPPGRVEWLLAPAAADGSVTRVTLRHGDLGMSPRTWSDVRLGWVVVLDSMKTYLETGRPLGMIDFDRGVAPDDVDAMAHRRSAIEANGGAWALLDRADRTPDDDEDLLRHAYAAAFHWARAEGRTAANEARASWLQSRVWAVLGHGDQALRYAQRCATVTSEAGLEDFDLAYAHEATARALACLGRTAEAAAELDAARSVPVADPEDKAILDGDLAAEPWFGLAV